jgi:hypothetical protein
MSNNIHPVFAPIMEAFTKPVKSMTDEEIQDFTRECRHRVQTETRKCPDCKCLVLFEEIDGYMVCTQCGYEIN